MSLAAFNEATAYVRANGSKPPVEEVTVAGGVIRRSYRIKAGSMMLSEIHEYDHLSFLLSGEAILRSGGEVKKLVGPCSLVISAGIEHELFAVTDCSWDCIHAMAFANSSILEGAA